MKVKQLMSAPASTCRADHTLEDCARVMLEGECGAVLLTDVENHVVGILTDRDICAAAYRTRRSLDELSARDHVEHRVIACRPEDEAGYALQMMEDNAVRRLAVVDEHGHPAGVISVDDLAAYVADAPGGQRDGVRLEDVGLVLSRSTRRPPLAL